MPGAGRLWSAGAVRSWQKGVDLQNAKKIPGIAKSDGTNPLLARFELAGYS
jgi:hypothetical protein